MKRILIPICYLLSAICSLALTPVQFPFQNYGGAPINAQFTLTPATNVVGLSNIFILGRPLNITATNGTVTTNLVPGGYIFSIVGISGNWAISVPDTTNVINAVSLITNLPVPVPGTFSGVYKILPGPGYSVSPTNGQGLVSLVISNGFSSVESILTETNPFTMPVLMQQQFAFQFQNSASTIYWATNGNDSTAVLGDTNHPAASFTKCLSILTNGGVVWAFPNQKFAFDTSSYTISQPVTLFGLNSQFGLGGIVTLNTITNLNMIGGSWDTLVYPQAPLKLRLMYCTLFPDWLAVSNMDGIYFIGNLSKPTYGHLDHVKIFSNYDCENQSGFLNSNSVFSASFSWFVASQSPSSISNPCRSFVAAGTNTSILNDCLFVATGSEAGLGSPPSSFTNVCVSALVGARVFLKNNIYIHGTPNIDSGVSIYLTGGSTVFLQDGMIPSNINSSGNILAPSSTTNSFIYTPLQ